MIDALALTHIGATPALAARYADALFYTSARWGINTPLRVQHWLAQLFHESTALRDTLELASGRAYEGRLGNVRPGDGVRYKGRGLIQLTGRANYRAFTLAMKRLLPNAPDFEARPELVEQLPWCVEAAGWFWRHGNGDLNRYADRDDIVAVTRRVNGGENGLPERRHYLSLAYRAIVPPPPPSPFEPIFKTTSWTLPTWPNGFVGSTGGGSPTSSPTSAARPAAPDLAATLAGGAASQSGLPPWVPFLFLGGVLAFALSTSDR